jgi:hypothetical protein
LGATARRFLGDGDATAMTTATARLGTRRRTLATGDARRATGDCDFAFRDDGDGVTARRRFRALCVTARDGDG